MHKRKRSRRNDQGINPTRKSERLRFERAIYILGARRGLLGDLWAMNDILNERGKANGELINRIAIAERNGINTVHKRADAKRAKRAARNIKLAYGEAQAINQRGAFSQ